MNQLDTAKRAAVVRCLVEGNSIRATVRMTGVAKNTVTKLLIDLGVACNAYQDRVMRMLPCKRFQLDEIWSFCYAKGKNVPPDKQGAFGYGDVWTWVALDAETKLIPSFFVGPRNAGSALRVLTDLAERVTGKIQLTTDGLRAYADTVPMAFGDNLVDYAVLQKLFGEASGQGPERKYSPGKCNGAKRTAVIGDPDMDHVSTSYVERQNLTMRMAMRRFTRLTNAFSKKVENLYYAVSLHFMHYNFARKHQTLKTTPAVAAGVADHVWSIEEIVGLLNEAS